MWTWACPCNECKGFLDNKNICGVCDRKYCKDCNVELYEGEDHVCDEDTKKTMRLLKRDSKPCPKCQCVIHKIDGCDQMWCPDCKTAFSWEKGTIETRVHNPHYYEYLRNTQGFVPREPEDEVEEEEEEEGGCGGLRFNENNAVFLGRLEYQHDGVRRHTNYMRMWRCLSHAQGWALDRWDVQTDVEDKQRLWRVRYLIGDITEKHWKKALQMQDKDLRKRAEIRSVLETYIQVGCDILRDMAKGNLDLNEKVEKHQKLIIYFQNIFVKISKLYGCVVPYFEKNEENDMYEDIISTKH